MNTTTLVHDTIAKEFGRILKGYQPLDRYGALPDNDPREMGHRSARAKQRQVFLKSYRLASGTELRRRRSRSLKLKKVVVKKRSPVSSVPPHSRFLDEKGKGLFFLLLYSCMDYAQRRVHPSDVEAAMETAPAYPSKYVMLNNSNSSSVRPPPQRRNIPRYHSNHHHSHGHCCLKCVCCCLCFFIVVIIVLASVLAVLYVTLNPKMPQYNVESFEVNAFTMDPDFSLYTEFVVVVKSNNPNKDIAFTYGKDSSVVVAYSDSTLCSGKLPAFHQPFQNTTMIPVVLTGKSEVRFRTSRSSDGQQGRQEGSLYL
ncbi:HIN1-LIKE PROTEIN [Salix purpurea]|uniref:HIN1-LIKE PROTEIN n=1 Tax=Salix purpurea TaxID=77065 RepID=A0A9Q0VCA4_SALPP|nr:HIN1-LIKE PROTEIN [Salix purpurea]